MSLKSRLEKPKTRAGKRHLQKREPKLVENDKTAVLVRGHTCHDTVMKFMKDVNKLKRPNVVMKTKKTNVILPFENPQPLEFFSDRDDASLFMFGSHNKKRPLNVILGRFFDHQVLDMFEFGLENYKGIDDFKGPKFVTDSKPCLMIAGDIFETHPEYKRLKNVLIDFFRGPTVPAINVAGLDHLLFFTATEEYLHMRSYRIAKDPETGKTVLQEMGPCADLKMRRNKMASEDFLKSAMKQPKIVKGTRKIKNKSKDAFGSSMGRIHMGKQDVDSMQTKRMKGLRKPKDDDDANAAASDKPAKKRKSSAGGNKVTQKKRRKSTVEDV